MDKEEFDTRLRELIDSAAGQLTYLEIIEILNTRSQMLLDEVND